MLRILGSCQRLCDGWTRREALRAGGLGLFGLSLADLFRLESAGGAMEMVPSATSSFGRARRCILLYLYGAPSQLDTFDLKPDAPAEIRGAFKPVSTALPGVSVCEHFPNLARWLDRCTLVRSLTHPYNIHSAAYTLTGTPTTDIPMELNPYDSRHWPFFGSVLDYLAARQESAAAASSGSNHPRRELPTSVGLPWKFSSRAEPFK